MWHRYRINKDRIIKSFKIELLKALIKDYGDVRRELIELGIDTKRYDDQLRQMQVGKVINRVKSNRRKQYVYHIEAQELQRRE